MKEDYLWDKTGQDSEIERLESALQAFRYQETAPPALPGKVLPFEIKKENPRRTFRSAFAFAACAATVVIALGLWLQFSPSRIEVAKDSPQTEKSELAKDSANAIAPQTDEKVSTENSFEKPNDLPVEKIQTPKHFVARNTVKIRKIVPTNARQNNLIARNVQAKKPSVKLTKEEKYAYDQLMLALAITGSKLKLVTDKIEGVEPQTIVPDNNR